MLKKIRAFHKGIWEEGVILLYVLCTVITHYYVLIMRFTWLTRPRVARANSLWVRNHVLPYDRKNRVIKNINANLATM